MPASPWQGAKQSREALVLVPLAQGAQDEPASVARPPLALLLSDTRLVIARVVPHFANIFLPLPRPVRISSFFVDITPLGLVFQIFLFVFSIVLIVPLGLASLVGGIFPLLAAALLLWPFLAAQGPPLVRLDREAKQVNASTWFNGNKSASTNGNGMSGSRHVRRHSVTVRRRSSSNGSGNQSSGNQLLGKPVGNVSLRHSPNGNGLQDGSTPTTFGTADADSSSGVYGSDEAWFFINGISTSRSGMRLALRRLEQLFQRPIVGIMNRTLGTIIDLAECIVQRDIHYETRDARTGYSIICAALENPKMSRVILLSHSQGGIISSLILDRLLAELSGELMQKLEVYTFACAANHFSNPARLPLKRFTSSLDEVDANAASSSFHPQRTIRHIEHFANGRDPISQIGVLAFAIPMANDLASGSTIDKEEEEALSAKRALMRRLRSSTLESGNFSREGRPSMIGLQNMPAERPRDVFDESKGFDGIGDASLSRVTSAPHQPYHGQLFVRWHASGHLLGSHYLHPHNNILDIPEARKYSRLRQYLGGKSPPL